LLHWVANWSRCWPAAAAVDTASRAAEVLRISQPAVSKAIQELEREIGFSLFHRAKERLILRIPSISAVK
jgi:DNA-binding transcriptional LysR family regulator